MSKSCAIFSNILRIWISCPLIHTFVIRSYIVKMLLSISLFIFIAGVANFIMLLRKILNCPIKFFLFTIVSISKQGWFSRWNHIEHGGFFCMFYKTVWLQGHWKQFWRLESISKCDKVTIFIVYGLHEISQFTEWI